VIGKTVSVAEAVLESHDLALGNIKEDESASRGLNSIKVISQSPNAGSPVLPGTKIDLVIPAQSKQVPSVVGFKYSEAQSALQELGFRTAMQTVSTGQADQGVIVSQKPLAGTKQKIGSSITLKVEKTKIRVPNVVGKVPSDAIRMIKAEGLKVKSRFDGRVMLKSAVKVAKQSPSQRKLVDIGATVTISYPKYGLVQDMVVMRPTTMAMSVIVAPRASGKNSIKQTWTADLDTNNAPSNSGADIWFEAKTRTERYVTPKNGATIANMGSKAPGAAGCKKAKLSKSSININKLKVNSYICVKTNKKQYSQVKITSLPAPNVGNLGIQFTTWN